MAGRCSLKNQTATGVTHERRSNFVVRAGHTDAVYRQHLIIIGLGNVGGCQVIICCLSSSNAREQSFSATRDASPYLIAFDRGIACIRLGPRKAHR